MHWQTKKFNLCLQTEKSKRTLIDGKYQHLLASCSSKTRANEEDQKQRALVNKQRLKVKPLAKGRLRGKVSW